jgi:hypothetical protein
MFLLAPPCHPEGRADTAPCFSAVVLALSLRAERLRIWGNVYTLPWSREVPVLAQHLRRFPKLDSGAGLAMIYMSAALPVNALFSVTGEQYIVASTLEGYNQATCEKGLLCGKFSSVQIRAEESGRGERRGDMSSITQTPDGRRKNPPNNDGTGGFSRQHASSERLQTDRDKTPPRYFQTSQVPDEASNDAPSPRRSAFVSSSFPYLLIWPFLL